MTKRVMSSLPTWWTCWGNSPGQDPSHPRRLRGWSILFTKSLIQYRLVYFMVINDFNTKLKKGSFLNPFII